MRGPLRYPFASTVQTRHAAMPAIRTERKGNKEAAEERQQQYQQTLWDGAQRARGQKTAQEEVDGTLGVY